MNKVERPNEKVKDVFDKCISKVSNRDLKQQLEGCVTEIVQDEKIYQEKAIKHKLIEFPKKNLINGKVPIGEMKKVYTYRMVNLNQPGRIFYNKLLNSIQICPFCSVRDVATLDHYLPKSQYASTVVTPVNLIPACRDCNSNKDVFDAEIEEEELWHPYYDDYGPVRWLYVLIIETFPPVAEYSIKIPFDEMEEVMGKRIQKSFDVFELGKLYSTHAAKELNDIEFYIKSLKREAGVNNVRKHLQMMYESFYEADSNSWRTALYEALANCDWYIEDYL
ncbi:HNH endonuclease [Lacrimispora sp.]|uniref:HNH endonuclease n=1 Tax=Lacrimispora sp. TaxID=2719234 RepID=UPI0028A5DAE6|nr:HNH endonuclease signature motif containing protein [Lacrimispora sp.]